MKESHIQKAIEEYLIYKGFLVLRINGGGKKRGGRYISFYHWQCLGEKSSNSGVSDILAFSQEYGAVAIETKRAKGGRVSNEQERFIKELRDRGFRAGICTSIEDVDKLLEKGTNYENQQ